MTGTTITEAQKYPSYNSFKHKMMTTLVATCSVTKCGETFKVLKSFIKIRVACKTADSHIPSFKGPAYSCVNFHADLCGIIYAILRNIYIFFST